MPTLLGQEAAELLGVAVTSAGGRLITARPQQIHWRPGRALTVVYHARVAWADRRATQERLVASTGARIPKGALVLERGADRVGIWTLTTDPLLPGLGVALDAKRARGLLDVLGVPPGAVQVRLRAYRPGRRGVVEVVGGRSRLFIKVVPPAEVAPLQARHALLSAHLPVPRSHGWSKEHGLVVLEAMPGRTLREVLSLKGQRLPDPALIAGMLDRIPTPGDGRRSPDTLSSAAGYAGLVGRLLPDLKARLTELVAGLGDGVDAGPLVPVHGDLHDAQLMVRNGAITGLLDVDTAGLGHRVDDWAQVLGHLATRMDAATGSTRTRIQEYGKQVLATAEAQVDRADLRRRVAAVVLGLATGPFRVQTPSWPRDTALRVALAERWWQSAESTRSDGAMRTLSPDS